jgi:hypothetical protein
MAQAGLELAMPASEWSQTHDFDRAATEIGISVSAAANVLVVTRATLITKLTNPGVLLRLRESARSVLL